MRFNDEEKRKFSFRLRWAHLLRLIDLAIIVALFFGGAWAFRTTVGERKLAEGQRLRQVAKQLGSRTLEQADSVVAHERGRLTAALADSVRWAEDLASRRAYLEAIALEQQQINEALNPLIDQSLDLHYASKNALAEQDQYVEDLKARKARVADLKARADEAARLLAEAQLRNEQARSQLAEARSTRAYDPVGLFPEQAGLVVRQNISATRELTNVEFQHSVWTPGVMDVGLSMGLGLGAQDVASSKQFGLVVSRSLIHRRLGLDLGAGYSVLTDQAGADEQGPYATASFRLSPFYKERFHLGLGARAEQEEFTPFLMIGLGRR